LSIKTIYKGAIVNRQTNPPSPQNQWIPVIIALIGAISAIGVAYFSSPPVARSAALGAVSTAAKEEVARQLPAQLPVGTIVASILPPVEFSRQNRDRDASNPNDWVPCDGTQVASRIYQQATSRNTVPDLRGLFLRGLNVFSIGTQPPAENARDLSDPDGKRLPGSGQTDTLGLQVGDIALNHVELIPFEGGGGNGLYGLRPMTPSSANIRVARETAPRNAAVYYYCKIN